MTLHIVGNGFDLHHRIKSSYKDFKAYAWKHTKDAYHLSMLEECYPIINPQTGDLLLWSDLERALGNLDFKAAFNISTEDIELEENHELRYQAEMEDAPSFALQLMYDNFHEIFNEWVNNIDINQYPDSTINHFDNSGLFLQFNYTETLELLYGVPQQNICYIHGRRGTNDTLIVGHHNNVDGDEQLSSDPMIYEYQAYDNIAQTVNNEQKQVSEIINKNRSFFKSLANVDKIVVYGHSLSEVDLPYFKEVSKNVKDDAEWYFSLYFNNLQEENEALGKVNKMIRYLNLNVIRCHTFPF